MAERRVVVENRRTGEQYAVTPAAFRKHYDDKGFRILHWEGGAAYEEGTRKPKAEAPAGVEPVGPQPQPEE
jgi:hypothetical protein